MGNSIFSFGFARVTEERHISYFGLFIFGLGLLSKLYHLIHVATYQMQSGKTLEIKGEALLLTVHLIVMTVVRFHPSDAYLASLHEDLWHSRLHDFYNKKKAFL